MHRSRVGLGLVLVAGLLLGASSPDPDHDRRLVVTLVDGFAASTERGALVPGAELPLDLLISNPYARPVRVTRLVVSVVGVSAPGASTTPDCPAADFSATPGGFTPLVVPPRSAASLTQAEVPSDRWPSLSMTDAAHDQDGCRHVAAALGLHVWGRMT